MHFTSRRIAGYVLPLAGFLAARLLHDPNASDHRPTAWLLPVGCFIGAVLLLADFKQKRANRSRIAMLYGAAALLVAMFYSVVFVALNGMMHR
jgi:hypothetical protein